MLTTAETQAKCATGERGTIDINYAVVSQQDENSDDDEIDKQVKKQDRERRKKFKSNVIGKLTLKEVSSKITERTKSSSSADTSKHVAELTNQVTLISSGDENEENKSTHKADANNDDDQDSMEEYYERANNIVRGLVPSQAKTATDIKTEQEIAEEEDELLNGDIMNLTKI